MWKTGLVALTVLAACAAPQSEFNRVGQGVTVQQRVVSAAGIDAGKASQKAASQRFNDVRDVGFAASSVAAGGFGGGVAGLTGVFASPATTRETIPHLLLEVPQGADVERYKATIANSAAPLIDRQPGTVKSHLTKQGTFGQKDLYSVIIYSPDRSWSNTSVQAASVYQALAQKYPSLLSAYVPPLRVNGQWQRPYLYRNGQNLPL